MNVPPPGSARERRCFATIATVLAVGAALSFASPAGAYRVSDCWHTRHDPGVPASPWPISYRYGTFINGPWQDAAESAKYTWYYQGGQATYFYPVTGSAFGTFQVSDSIFGNRPGQARLWHSGVYEPSPLNCVFEAYGAEAHPDGRNYATAFIVDVNSNATYSSQPGYLNPTQKEYVALHEFGHALGIAHNQGSFAEDAYKNTVMNGVYFSSRTTLAGDDQAASYWATHP